MSWSGWRSERQLRARKVICTTHGALIDGQPSQNERAMQNMMWPIILILVLLLLLISGINKFFRLRMLNRMQPEERAEFLKAEIKKKSVESAIKSSEARIAGVKAAEREVGYDYKASEEILNAIRTAKAEGKSYVRVWVPESRKASVLRWARRERLGAHEVKKGNRNDTLISFSGF